MDPKNEKIEILIDMDEFSGPSYEELAQAWWAIYVALDVEHNPWKQTWHNTAFCDLLKQCGWTIEAWNDESEWRKPAAKGGLPPEK